MNTRRLLAAGLGPLLLVAGNACAQEEEIGHGQRTAAAASKPDWEFGATLYPTHVRGGENYNSAILVADRGALHLEARVNYEAIGARSAFVGWTFSGGETLIWELTPLLGGAWGEVNAWVPGLEASLAWGRFDFYIEAEYVRDRTERSSSYLYAWSELGFKTAEWLRLGLAAQRTRAYGGEREIQRGPFVQLNWKQFTIGGYWFNPGSNEQVFVGSIGVTF
jgi:hypothetical protein